MDKRISELDPGAAIDGTELLPMAQGIGTDALTVSTTPFDIGDYVLARLAAGTGITIVVDTDGVATITAPGAAGGTVTHTGGALTANAVVLGAGANDTKVVSGITTDGTSALNLGVAGASVGKVVLANATSGSITVQPAAGALGTVTLTAPAASGTIARTADITGTNSGTNTGDQTSVSGNAGTATALQTARTIGGVSFDGTADITQPFDVHAFYPGLPTASAKVLRVPIARAIAFAANFAGSYFAASANATGTTDFDVQKNGVSIGTVSIAAAGTTATFTTTSGTGKTFAAGDVLSIIAPVTPDATLADPGFVLAGTR